MKIKNKKMFKIATISMIAAFSFGLSLSSISSVNRSIKPVSAENGTASWSYNSNNKTLTCTDVSTYSNEFIDETNQTSVVGLGNGQYEITYNVLGYSSGSMQPDMDDLGTYKLVFIMGSYEKLSDDSSPYGIITASPNEVNGLDSNQEYEIYVNVAPTGDMNEQGTGGGNNESGTVIYYDASVGFYYGTTEQVVLSVRMVDFAGSDNFQNGTATVHLIDDDNNDYSTTMSNVSLEPVPTESSGGYYTGSIFGYIDESQCNVNYHPLESVILNYEVEGTPEPPALSALEWYFDTGMGYFSTNTFRDEYYYFSLSTEIVSVIYDRVNSTVTANCIVNSAREGNMPEEYYEAEMTFEYTFTEGGLVENTWRFYDAVCATTIEETEDIYFSPNIVSFRQLGWYYDQNLKYYVEEGVTASWNILHAEYRTEGSRNELTLDMQIHYDTEYTNDVIQINNPNFNEAPYRGQTTLSTGVSGWSDRLQQNISIECNYVSFAYYADGWSYDSYYNQLVYINADDIDMKYQLTSASSNEGSYLLTYTCDGDSQSITVTGENYEDQMLTGKVVLVENSDPITVTVSVPQSIMDGGTTSTGTWNYDSANHTLVYYDESHGGSYNMTSAKVDSLSHKATITYQPVSGTSGSPVSIEITNVLAGSYNASTNMLTGYAQLDGPDSEEVEISFYLENLQGSRVDLSTINDWIYTESNVYWMNSEEQMIQTDELIVDSCTFYNCTSNPENQYFEVDYYYDNLKLPTLTLTKASYTGTETHVVSGIFANNVDLTCELTISSNWNETDLAAYSYVVIFDANGGQGNMDPDRFSADESPFKYTLPDCEFHRDGYTFIGWSPSSGGLIKIQPGGTRDIYASDETTTFFAIWAVNVTVSFNANGGSGTMESITVASGTTCAIPDCEFTRPGYMFVCWAVGSPTSLTKLYPTDDPVTVSQDYVLYAIWEEAPHEGWWYDDNTHKFRYFDVEVRQELTVNTEVFLLDFGENTAETRGYIVAETYYDNEVRDAKYLDVRTYTVGVESGNRYISCNVALDGETTEQVKLYPDTIHYNVMKPGLNYAEGYNELWHVTDDYYGTVVEPEEVKFNEITRTFSIYGYAEDPTGEQDLVEYFIQLTDGVVNDDDGVQDIRTIEGYCAEFGKRIKLNVRYIEYNSLEEESITEETVAEINTSMDSVELSEDQKYQINQAISNNADKIPDSTGSIIAEALDGTTDLISSNEEYAEVQKEIIVLVVETAIEVETNKPSNVGQSIRTDSSLPANAGISIEKEVREFYERQMQELLGGNTYPTRLKTRGNDNDYQINVDISHIENPDDVIPYLEDELDNYGKMTEFIEDSVDNMNTAGRKLRTCSGEAMKVEVRKTVTKIKTSSFRDFDKDAADLQFAYDVHNAMMLHLQEVVVTTLEKDYKPSGNKEKDEQYQAELEACKDIESFTEIVIEVLRQKYNALTDSNVEYEEFVSITFNEETQRNEYGKIYWEIFEAWCLDKECPYPITFQELTDSTVEVTTQNARGFELNTKVTNTEVVFTAAFVGGSVAFISLAGVLGYVLKKRSLKGVK